MDWWLKTTPPMLKTSGMTFSPRSTSRRTLRSSLPTTFAVAAAKLGVSVWTNCPLGMFSMFWPCFVSG